MEDDKKTTESTYTLDNKHFWAAFLNLARHNVYITVNHINKTLELKNKKDQDIIIDNDQDILAIKTLWEKVNGDLNKTERLRELMTKHFPFLEATTYRRNPTDTTKQKEEKQRNTLTLKYRVIIKDTGRKIVLHLIYKPLEGKMFCIKSTIYLINEEGIETLISIYFVRKKVF
mgnify:CR=1 FL=1